jgi:hypothetical protein
MTLERQLDFDAGKFASLELSRGKAHDRDVLRSDSIPFQNPKFRGYIGTVINVSIQDKELDETNKIGSELG